MGNVYKRKKWLKIFFVLIILLLISIVFSLGIGAVKIPAGDIIGIFVKRILYPGSQLNPSWPESFETIILNIRLPRVALAALVGMALALAGTTYQGIFINPMADPYIIGASSGASLGASIAILLSLNFSFLGISSVPFFAFLGSLGTVALVYRLAKTGEKIPVMTLLLSGIAVTTFVSAFVSLFVYFSGQRLHQILFWMMGGFASASWLYVKMIFPYVILGFAVNLFFARELNIMLLGEETAHHLGVSVEKLKKMLLISSSILTAAAVSVSGIIGFVGLVVPHMVRLIVGPDHRILVPSSALFGASYLILADTIARSVLPPEEIPVGIITSIFGGPFFIYLLKRRKDQIFLGG